MSEVTRRLPSLSDLNEIVRLLNIPRAEEVDLTSEAPMHEQAAVLLAKIAEWASQGAHNAKCGLLEYYTRTYAYLIETIDEHQTSWWQADIADSGGIEESTASPEAYALVALTRFLDQVRAHPDDYEQLLDNDLHARVSVWDIDRVASSRSAPRVAGRDPALYGTVLKNARIAPHAVEIRAPVQVHRHIFGG
ncbi:MAG: hypothetical protein JWL58_1653 [Streptosporangiaceae bacterium]|jgi:hypothetical protein|nr:hypothetical protein [Streptosporangiaceae bacterium]